MFGRSTYQLVLLCAVLVFAVACSRSQIAQEKNAAQADKPKVEIVHVDSTVKIGDLNRGAIEEAWQQIQAVSTDDIDFEKSNDPYQPSTIVSRDISEIYELIYGWSWAPSKSNSAAIWSDLLSLTDESRFVVKASPSLMWSVTKTDDGRFVLTLNLPPK